MSESLVRVAPSGWAGIGLFAAVDLPSGLRLLEYRGEVISKEESARRRAEGNAYVFHLDLCRAIDGESLDNVARYVNHSCAPNCRIEIVEQQIWIVSARPITAGEELSFDYGFDTDEYWRYPCGCGAAVCCGYMVGRQYWGLLPQHHGPEAWEEGLEGP